jgi:hypothetical protein
MLLSSNLFVHSRKGRAVHCIFYFPKEGKQKDAISIPYANSVSEYHFS